jgi:cystine transport system substrate-binding protein
MKATDLATAIRLSLLVVLLTVGSTAVFAAAPMTLTKGALTVGLMGTYPPYNFLNATHQVDGFDADIAKEVAKRLGMQVKFVPTEWSGMVEGLLKGKFDAVISQMTITDDRKKVMDFSQPYMKNPVNVIVRADNTSITGLSSLKGKRVGVGLGTNDEAWLRNVAIPQVGQFTIATYDDVITSLKD